MNVIVVGLGSMGKRRIRLIRKIHPKYVIVGVDTNSQRCSQAAQMYGIITYSCLEEALTQGSECAFVCTSPITHPEIINKCLQRKMHVFTELNLVADGYDDNMLLAKKNGCLLFCLPPSYIGTKLSTLNKGHKLQIVSLIIRIM
ncbi:MAG: Gfo/Idh/MocA family oxidoreductase [Clostridium sp.]|nr:Gfo/Idh/MocA family oxidoreductase [Clostridium sp.]